MRRREEKGLQSISLLPACVSRKTVSVFSSHKIHPRRSFSCRFVLAFEKKQLSSSTLQCELGKGIYCVSLFSCFACTDTLTDHFLFSFLIRFPIYTLTVHFFLISSSAGSKAVAGRHRNINSMPYNILTASVWHLNCSSYKVVSVG